jgi:hypothetical protein
VHPALDPARFTIRTLEQRLESTDPWRAFWRTRQPLPDLSRPKRVRHAR